MSGIVVRVPHVPHWSLNPNARKHELGDLGDRERTTPAHHRKVLRTSARLSTVSHLNAHPWPVPAGRIGIQLFVAWPSYKAGKELPDEDNLISSCKPLLDGIADGLGVNDNRFKLLGIDQNIDPEGAGFVAVAITDWKG